MTFTRISRSSTHGLRKRLSPFVEQGVYRPIQVDPLEKLKQIQDRATELAKSGSADDKRLLDEYVRYVDSLRDVYERFLTTVQRRRQPP
jgi:hypothetical protein